MMNRFDLVAVFLFDDCRAEFTGFVNTRRVEKVTHNVIQGKLNIHDTDYDDEDQILDEVINYRKRNSKRIEVDEVLDLIAVKDGMNGWRVYDREYYEGDIRAKILNLITPIAHLHIPFGNDITMKIHQARADMEKLVKQLTWKRA